MQTGLICEGLENDWDLASALFEFDCTYEEDLDYFLETVEREWPNVHDKLVFFDAEEPSHEELNDFLDELTARLIGYAPAGYFFGVTSVAKQDFGFWPVSARS